MTGDDVAKMIANIVKAIHARKKKAKAAGGAAGSSWEAMLLEQAGPGRSDVIVPPKKVNLARSD